MAERLIEPPEPLQLRMNVLVSAVSAPVLADPDVGRLPLHAPLAVQLVASAEDQVRAAEEPLLTLVGVALNVSVGPGTGGAPLTMTVADCARAPPAPVHVRVKTLLGALSAPVLAVPDVPRLPDHAPLAAQDAASAEDHVSVEDAPLLTADGVAVSDRVGGPCTCTGAGGGAGFVSEPPLHDVRDTAAPTSAMACRVRTRGVRETLI